MKMKSEGIDRALSYTNYRFHTWERQLKQNLSTECSALMVKIFVQ